MNQNISHVQIIKQIFCALAHADCDVYSSDEHVGVLLKLLRPGNNGNLWSQTKFPGPTGEVGEVRAHTNLLLDQFVGC